MIPFKMDTPFYLLFSRERLNGQKLKGEKIMPEEITEKAGAVPVDKGKEPESLPGKQGKEETSDSSPEMVMDKDGKPATTVPYRG